MRVSTQIEKRLADDLPVGFGLRLIVLSLLISGTESGQLNECGNADPQDGMVGAMHTDMVILAGISQYCHLKIFVFCQYFCNSTCSV